MLSFILSVLPSGMNFEIFRVIVAVLGTGIATYFDLFNNKNIPEKFLYGFLLISCVFLIIDSAVLLPSLFWAGLVGITTYLLYRAGQLGGADVIIFVALTLLLPTTPVLFVNESFFMPLILSLVILSGLFLMMFIILKYGPKLILKTIKGEIKMRADKLFYAIALIFMFAVVVFILSDISMGNPLPFILLLGFIVLVTLFHTLYREDLTLIMSEEIDLSKKSDASKIEPEDVVALELMDRVHIVKHSIPKLLTKTEIERLKREKVKLIVMTKLPPFLPFIFIALLIQIFMGDILYYIISGMFLNYLL